MQPEDINTLPPAETVPELEPVPTRPNTVLDWKKILPVVVLALALPGILVAVKLRTLIASDAATPFTYPCSISYPCPTPTPPCSISYPCTTPPCGLSYPCPTPTPPRSRPDITVSAITIGGSVGARNVNIRVCNVGTVRIPSTTRGADRIKRGTRSYIWTSRTYPQNPGSCVTRTVTCAQLGVDCATRGSYTAGVDIYNRVIESRENNNTLTVSLP